MTHKDLKPCPFCGHKAIIHRIVLGRNQVRYQGICRYCRVTTPILDTFNDVGLLWNTRWNSDEFSATRVRGVNYRQVVDSNKQIFKRGKV